MTATDVERTPPTEAQRQVLAEATPEELTEAEAWLVVHDQRVTDKSMCDAVLQARRRAQPGWKPAKKRNKETRRRLNPDKAWWPSDPDEEQAFKSSLDIDKVGKRLAWLIIKCQEQAGMVPTFAELGRVMGWNTWQTNIAVRKCAKAGWVKFGTQPRSLKPGRRAKAAA